MSAYLKYIGNGSYFPDVPARDLTEAEAKYHGEGRLLDSGLYEKAEQKTEPEKKVVPTAPPKRNKP